VRASTATWANTTPLAWSRTDTRCTCRPTPRCRREHDDALLDGLDAPERERLHELLSRIAEARQLVSGVHPGYRTLGAGAGHDC
jgi:hypothetical protein